MNFKNSQRKKNKWLTMAGTFNITSITDFELKLPELNNTAEIYTKFHLIINY